MKITLLMSEMQSTIIDLPKTRNADPQTIESDFSQRYIIDKQV